MLTKEQVRDIIEDFDHPIRDNTIIWLCLVVVAVFVTWASVAELDRVVRASGQVVPSARTQIVQNLEGGIVEKLTVEEGDIVESGEELLRLDRTRFESSVGELEQDIVVLRFRSLRLQAEIEGLEQLEVPDDLAASRPDLHALETQLFEARRKADQTQRRNLARLIDMRSEEVDLLRPLVDSGAVPALQLMGAEVALTELETQLSRYETEYQREIAQMLSEVAADLDRLEQSVSARRDQLRRTLISAPASGVVNQLFFSTVGAVIGPGEPILEIVPSDEGILIEVRVQPKDIGYIIDDMEAILKVTAFDYSVFGTLSGHVVRIGADTVPHPDDRTQPPAFLVAVRVDDDSLTDWLARDLDLRTGMVVEAELQAGATKVLQYMLKPILRAKEALSEV